MRYLVLAAGLFFMSAAQVPAQQNPTGLPQDPFRQLNPDIDKFAFARSFISSLSYYGRVNQRLLEEQAVGDSFTRDLLALKALIDNRTMDNADLRVAKNYMVTYAKSGNMLIRKVAYDLAVAYENYILVSSKERMMWQAYYKFKSTGLPRDLNEDAFKGEMESLARDRKAVSLEILGQVVTFRKVVLSAALCGDEHCQQLALTQKERDKLVRRLDAFAGGNTAWGMQQGQGTFEAAIASVREILEDPVFVSRE